ncbi:MAG: O-antigen ligase family protein [Verrucomicrobia bacterium]|nr:O-antigen ligase family protein [Verrucomicrobiota bacterium]
MRRHLSHTPKAYKVCDGLTEALIYFLAVFTPWAFGTTQDWSIWTANAGGYLLGCLLVAKWVIRWRTGYVPSRWGEREGEDQGPKTNDQGREGRDREQEDGTRGEGDGPEGLGEGPKTRDQRPGTGGQRTVKWTTWALAALTVFILLYSLIGALNPRATYYEADRRFDYHDNYIVWLPHSYDPASTWQAFWNYLALAFFFWASRDWLLGKTSRERKHDHRSHEPTSRTGVSPVPDHPAPPDRRDALSHHFRIPNRLQRLLWVLCLSGGLLAIEGILQRLSGTGKLLWLIRPRFNQTADAQFGPYAYRSNAATYFNLVWPVCVGFWLVLRRSSIVARRAGARVGGGSYVLLLPCAVLMAAAPIISTARGGALVALGNILAVSAVLFVATRREGSIIRASMLSLFIIIPLFAGYLGWKQLAERLENMFVDDLSKRTEIYANSRTIAEEFPALGTGPGSFGTIYRLYKEAGQQWEAYLHDDWLETRITFGWIGFGVICLMLILVLARWFVPGGGIPMRWDFLLFTWLALAGCLAHAKLDFPFQIYSLQFLFLLLCSMLFCLSRR